ncbi:hypothetical protein NUW58_g6126 [Xylaria curta]|uniref:Uncharacterized protein n=1 Tax=Xylaria curta TaxID=42375 RepID=A0ACC1NZD1_9PEZI|nr:hypothetical protein NUW58_g6126 [Xylaria curta]
MDAPTDMDAPTAMDTSTTMDVPTSMNARKKQSNIDRTKWRTKCRKLLAEHIKTKLGLHVDPSQVRLTTSLEDGYAWETLPETKYLFSKNLSDHSIRAFKILCCSVGVTFEAVRSAPEPPIYPRESSFNNNLSQQLQATKSQLEAEIKLRLSFDEKLQLAYKRSECLQKELQATTWRETNFRNMIKKYSYGFSKLEGVLSQLQEMDGMMDLYELNGSVDASSLSDGSYERSLDVATPATS